MFLAALLELVPNSEEIINELSNLKNFLSGISKLEIKLFKIKRNDIAVNQLNIDLKEKKQHRTVNELRVSLNTFLDTYIFSKPAKVYANEVLDLLIKAESEVHNKIEEKIHLHELSSVDTLIDILGVTKCLDQVGVFEENYQIYSSTLPVGGGNITSAHGLIPIPSPASVKILEKFKMKVRPGPIEEELSTPTGIALLVNLKPIVESPNFILEKVVSSSGQKKFKRFINVFRILKGNKKEDTILNEIQSLSKYSEKVSAIETNVDDVSGEIIGDFIELMENDKILDIQIIQSITKKNRPSYIIRILCKPVYKFGIIEKLITNLGTLGVRYYTINRICVEREIQKMNIEIDQNNYSINYKISYYLDGNEKKIVNIKPEYDNLKELSRKTGHSIRNLLFLIQTKLQDKLNETL